MTRAAYIIEFELSHNAWTDLGGDLHAATPVVAERGIRPGERVASVGELTFALYDPDGRYTPGSLNLTTGFDVGVRVRLRADDGGGAVTLFTGRLSEVTPERHAERRRRGRVVNLKVLDDIQRFNQAAVGPYALTHDVHSGEVIESLLRRGPLPPHVLDYWLLGYPEAASKLGVSTLLGPPDAGKAVSVGQSTFPWVGDGWPAGWSLMQVIEEVVRSEGGTLYIAADGTITFAERHVRPKHTTPDAELESGLVHISASIDRDRVVNRVEVTVHPREVSEETEILWETGASIRVLRTEPTEVIINYRDPNEESALIGAQEVITPVQGVDYTADGSRTDSKGKHVTVDVTEFVHVEAEIGAASARLFFTYSNPSPKPKRARVRDLRIRGVPLRVYEPLKIIAEDEGSHLQYGRRTRQIDLTLEDDPDVALDLSTALLVNDSQPRARLTVELEGTAGSSYMAHALNRDVGDRLHVSDDVLGLDEAACFIDRIRHTITQAGTSHRVTWFTGPADVFSYWVIGVTEFSELNESTRLGY